MPQLQARTPWTGSIAQITRHFASYSSEACQTDSSRPHGEKPCAVPSRSSDDRVCKFILGLSRRSASKLWKTPKLVCDVCTPRANGTCIDRSTFSHFATGVGYSVSCSKGRMDRRSTLPGQQSTHGYICYPTYHNLNSDTSEYR
jgi:hypothetical protein